MITARESAEALEVGIPQQLFKSPVDYGWFLLVPAAASRADRPGPDHRGAHLARPVEEVSAPTHRRPVRWNGSETVMLVHGLGRGGRGYNDGSCQKYQSGRVGSASFS